MVKDHKFKCPIIYYFQTFSLAIDVFVEGSKSMQFLYTYYVRYLLQCLDYMIKFQNLHYRQGISFRKKIPSIMCIFRSVYCFANDK